MASIGTHSNPLDCLVVGLGGIGSTALFYARQLGWSVHGIDQFGVAHDRGSSHGQTRIIRTAYFEHPNYVPLTKRAFGLWEEAQANAKQNLLTKCGLLQVGPPDGEVVQGVMQSAEQHELDVETLEPDEIVARYPILKATPGRIGLFEKQAGFLRVENCVASFAARAVSAGATTSVDERVESWSVHDNGLVDVRTDRENMFSTKRLIVTGGSWAEQILGLPLGFEIVKKQQHWFQLDHIGQKLGNGFPCFLFEDDGECFYGVPEYNYLGMKVAEHSGGETVAGADSIVRKLDSAELERTVRFLEQTFHFTRQRLVHHSPCMYTRSRDEHFVVDHHPLAQNVVFAAGLSGHGFKFAPVLGKRLVEMLQGEQDQLFDFLRLDGRYEIDLKSLG